MVSAVVVDVVVKGGHLKANVDLVVVEEEEGDEETEVIEEVVHVVMEKMRELGFLSPNWVVS